MVLEVDRGPMGKTAPTWTYVGLPLEIRLATFLLVGGR